DGYLAKPIRSADLYAAIERLTAVAKPAEVSLLDRGTLHAACGGDQELLDEIVQLFRARSPELLAKVQDAADRGDAAGLAHAAHTCKGVVATFSSAAAEAARALEHLGRSGRTDGAGEVVQQLARVLGELDAALPGVRVVDLR